MTTAERTIKHVRYTDNGVEYFDVIVPQDNYDDKNVFITKELLKQIAKTGHKGDTSFADYSGRPRVYWYKDGDLQVEISNMRAEHKGNTYEFVFGRPTGKTYVVVLPIKEN